MQEAIMARNCRTGESMRKLMMGLAVVLGFGLAAAVPVEGGGAGGVEPVHGGGVSGLPDFDCGFVKSEEALAAIQEAVAKGGDGGSVVAFTGRGICAAPTGGWEKAGEGFGFGVSGSIGGATVRYAGGYFSV